MELIVFDLDGTLLNKQSTISAYTRDTLALLREQGIAYTLATGRALHAADSLIKGHGFDLPHIYKNGVFIWNPLEQRYSQSYLLSQHEIKHVMGVFFEQQVTPFVFTLEPGDKHAVYHSTLQNETERKLVDAFQNDRGLSVLPLSELPADAQITNISSLGSASAIDAIALHIIDEPNLVAYQGIAIEDKNFCWLDVHHTEGSKGGAVTSLKEELGAKRVICFGDSDNDLSMFALADEAYAPENAKPEVKASATAVIGHHDEDGIARFLRERFNL
ncbi:MAG: Cof subfamily protein (haloacid dehalogenase superfamily) [Halieaceae bacterium]|jgi:Cof subfamily protein (haloacid dehalogenase superfamily)